MTLNAPKEYQMKQRCFQKGLVLKKGSKNLFEARKKGTSKVVMWFNTDFAPCKRLDRDYMIEYALRMTY